MKRVRKFEFYPEKWLSDEHVITMTLAEKGLYFSLLIHCFEYGSAPDDADEYAGLIGMYKRRVRKAWPVVRRRFIATDEPGRMIYKPASFIGVVTGETR